MGGVLLLRRHGSGSFSLRVMVPLRPNHAFNRIREYGRA
jgi:hypothetical protein